MKSGMYIDQKSHSLENWLKIFEKALSTTYTKPQKSSLKRSWNYALGHHVEPNQIIIITIIIIIAIIIIIIIIITIIIDLYCFYQLLFLNSKNYSPKKIRDKYTTKEKPQCIISRFCARFCFWRQFWNFAFVCCACVCVYVRGTLFGWGGGREGWLLVPQTVAELVDIIFKNKPKPK